MKHIIDKSVNFCYGHRVWSQTLDTNFTARGDECLSCRHLHGHEGLIKVMIEEIIPGKNVGNTGMVVDFKMMGWFKNFIDDYLDHKMILDLSDPLLPAEVPEIWGVDSIDEKYLSRDDRGFATVNIELLDLNTDNAFDRAIYEKYEGMVFVDFVPTSENLAGWLLTVAAEKMKGIDNVRVCAIEYWETPKSHCRVEI